MNAGSDPGAPKLADATLEAIKAQLRAGQKIAAIKLLREASGLSLLEAKQAVERLHAELHAKEPQRYPSPAGKGCGIVGVALALAAAVAGLILFLLMRG